jgi:hypothetical protein
MESDPFAESCQRLPEIGAGRTPPLIEMGVTEWFCKTFSGDLGALLNRNEYPTTHWTGPPLALVCSSIWKFTHSRLGQYFIVRFRALGRKELRKELSTKSSMRLAISSLTERNEGSFSL